MTDRFRTDVWLLRHGEIASYEGDHGLTEHGAAQARRAARALAEQLPPDGPPLRLLHATSARATETARHLGLALSDHGVALDGPAPDPGFDNVTVVVDGEVRPHDELRAAIVKRRATEPVPGPEAPDWYREGHRFAYIHDGGGDPIQWWLTQPCLAYEPPARVVRRIWRALSGLVGGGDTQVAVCTHSAPIRAIAAEAAGRDLGEPAHLEMLHIRLGGPDTGDRAQLSYRGEMVALALPMVREPAWP